MSNTTFPALLELFCDSTGLESLHQEDDSIAMNINGVHFSMDWNKQTDTVFVYTSIGLVDSGQSNKELYRSLLVANAPGGNLGGLALGLVPGFDVLTLSGTLFGYRLTLEQLQNYIGFFVITAAQWKKRLAGMHEG